jgi:hypothetical protein
LLPEILHVCVESGFVEIELGAAADQGKAEIRECFGHQCRVVAGVIEACNILVGRVSHDQRNALLSQSGTCK